MISLITQLSLKMRRLDSSLLWHISLRSLSSRSASVRISLSSAGHRTRCSQPGRSMEAQFCRELPSRSSQASPTATKSRRSREIWSISHLSLSLSRVDISRRREFVPKSDFQRIRTKFWSETSSPILRVSREMGTKLSKSWHLSKKK